MTPENTKKAVRENILAIAILVLGVGSILYSYLFMNSPKQTGINILLIILLSRIVRKLITNNRNK